MRTLLRITVLGIFAAAGLAMAVSVALHLSPADAADRAKVDEPVLIASQVPPPPPPKPASSPTSLVLQPASGTSPEAIRDVLDETLGRWSASYLPAITRQFEQLEQAQDAAQRSQEAAQRAQESAQRTADDLNKIKEQVQTPAPREDLPTSDVLPRALGPGSTTAPEVQRNATRDLVSVTAPNSDIREVLKTMSEATGLNILATPSVIGSVSVSLTDVALDEALTAILKSSGFSSRREGNFIYVGTVDELQDLATANDKVGTRVYQPNYVSATELQKLFTPMLSKAVGMIAISTASEVGIATNKTNAGGNSYAGAETVLVRDFATVLEHMDRVFEEVDRMPAQVAIEAMILSVKLADKDTLGVNFELLRNQENIRIVSGLPATDLANLNLNDGGLRIGFLDTSTFVFVEALETIGDTHVIASPHVMCLNKQRAEIHIGSQLGYVSTTQTETAATQTVEFLEVGTQLAIRPFISGDGMVRMEVHPELSTGNVRVEGGFTLPDKDVTQVTTNIMCRSGATVVIGGLIREDLKASSTQIPVLGNLPLVGALFRQRTEETERSEIIVLLTPRIVGEPGMYAEAEHAATQFRDRRNAFYDKMQPINKRRIAERYYRLAVSAWAAGDGDMALRDANLAIHYDSLHQGAVDLRQEVLAVNPGLEPAIHNHLRYGLRPWEHPERDYSRETGWPWRAIGPAEAPSAYPIPMDTGTSGPIRAIVTDRK